MSVAEGYACKRRAQAAPMRSVSGGHRAIRTYEVNQSQNPELTTTSWDCFVPLRYTRNDKLLLKVSNVIANEVKQSQDIVLTTTLWDCFVPLRYTRNDKLLLKVSNVIANEVKQSQDIVLIGTSWDCFVPLAMTNGE